MFQFSDDAALRRRERLLLSQCLSGDYRDELPERPSSAAPADDDCIRAELLSFLIRGGDERRTPTHKGVRLRGAYIVGDLDLSASDVKWPIELENCWIAGKVDISDANLLTLSLRGSRIAGLDGELVKVRGVLTLANGFLSEGVVVLSGAEIGGALDCSGGAFINPKGNALEIFRAKLADCFLSGVNEPTDPHKRPFTARGGVFLTGSKIGGSVYCNNGNFYASEEPVENDDDRRDALNFAGAEIADTLALRGVYWVVGKLDLRGATIDKLQDETDIGRLTLRHPRDGEPPTPNLMLDGLVFRRFSDTPTDFKNRRNILVHQIERHLSADFRPQPWEQVIKVLREMGRPEDARRIAIEKQTRLRRAGKIGKFLRLPHLLFGGLLGYGYRPGGALVVILGVWLSCAGVYQHAFENGAIAPAKTVLQNAVAALDCDPHATETKPGCYAGPAKSYGFSALSFSADLLFPFVDLQQRKEWAPVVIEPTGATASADGHIHYSSFQWNDAGLRVRRVMWAEIAFAWFATGVLGAVAAGLVKKD